MKTIYGLTLVVIIGFWVWTVSSYLKEHGRRK